MFSFHATKLFHTAEGGALTCKDTDLKRCIDLLKNFGIKSEDEVVMASINGKMNEIQAALGLINLSYLEAERGKRKRIIDTYTHCLRDIEGINLNELSKNVKNSYQYFVIRIEQERFGISRDEVYKRLREYNVYARKYFYPLRSDYPCYRNLPSADPANLPVAKKVIDEVMCLPLYGELAIALVEKICEIIRRFGR